VVAERSAKLQVVGGGRMGEALVAGLVRAGWAREDELRVVETMPARARELRERFVALDVVDAPSDADGHVIAVKPHDVAAVCAALASHGARPVLSIAAGVRLATLEVALASGTPVVRAMPNTPALVGEGAAAVAPGAHAGDDDLAWAESILAAVGRVVRVDEAQLDAVTGLSGSGPAYVFLLAEALMSAGEAVGLAREDSVELTTQTILGAARLLAEGDETPEALRAQVTSPGGTTEAGVAALEAARFREAVAAAVQAATTRSRELGGS
jgi:pyrroline-5-carboxylate reductase